MMNTPLKNYGFNYEFEGKQFAFDIVAETMEQAKNKVLAMTSATLFGEMKEDDPAEVEQKHIDAANEIERLREGIESYLKANNTEEFGCACLPEHKCGPCREYDRQQPLRYLLTPN